MWHFRMILFFDSDKAVLFPVVMYGCESWTIKKAERWRQDASELSCWRRLLGVPWTARRSNQSILKEINPEYSLEELMLKLQYFSHVKSNSLEKPLMLGKIEGRRRRGQQRMRWFEQILGDSEGQGSLTCFMTTVHVVTKNQTQLSNWTTKTRHERSHIV